MKKLIILMTTLLIISSQLLAQTVIPLKGQVTDAKTGETMVGVYVMVKGTSIGTSTDIDGKYQLNVPQTSPILVFTNIGYKTLETQISSNQTILNIQMIQDEHLLDEVVVVGYGSMKKSDLSGASVSVGEESLKGSIITNLDQALQGRAAGVTSVSTSGAPGGATSIRVRGQSTINANAEPLYVIDGVIVQSTGGSAASYGLEPLGNGSSSTISPLSTINPADILSMEILKDASATAIYGAQGANGVVLITTKRGKAGEAKFTYNGMYGIQRQSSRINMMNLQDFANYANDFAQYDSSFDNPEYSDVSLLGNGTNWQDAIFQHAPMQQHQLSASGGTDKVKYYISGSYLNQDGTVIGTKFDRYSFRTNLDANLKKWFKVGVNISYSKTNENLVLVDSEEGVVRFALDTPPDIPIYDMDGGYASVVREGYTRVNPIALAEDDDRQLKREQLQGNVYANIDIIKGLSWRSEVGFNSGHSTGKYFNPTVKYGSYTRSQNKSSWRKNDNTYFQIKNYLTYNKDYKKHHITAMAGQEAWESNWEYLSAATTNLPSNDVQNPNLGEDPTISSGFGKSTMASFYTRLTYNYDDRYFATYTYRYDGSSNFGPENRWAGFHAGAASWKINNEEFFEPLKDVVSTAKLRIGWGQTGNSNIGGYKWGAAISKMPSSLGLGYRQSNIANPYIQWETQNQTNLGIDLGFFDNRIMLTVDLYNKISKDMLMPMQLPSYMGTRGNASSVLASPWGNYGKISNKGLEIALTTHNFTGEFTWDTDFQISFNKNKLEALDGTEASAIEGYGQWSDIVTLSKIGEPLYSFYGYKVDGVYQDLEDLQNSPKPVKYPSDGVFNRTNTTWVGDLKYKDISGPNGEPDGVIDNFDRTKIGSPMPDFTFGMTNTFAYKNFDMSIFITGSYGNDILNYMSMTLSNMSSSWYNQLEKVKDRTRVVAINPDKTYPAYVNGVEVNNWYDDITNVVASGDTDIPRAISNDPNDNDRISDRYIEDGSYIRIKNITFGYTFSDKLSHKLGIQKLRVYTNLQNLFTFTKYSGYDPEIGVSTTSSNVYGLDNGRYPSPQVYTFGINLTF